MKAITLFAAVLTLGAVAVQAQVALPDFVPGAPRFLHSQTGGLNSATITPDNPGALAWGTPSRVVGGVLEGENTDNTGVIPPADFSGTVLGLRLVGEMFSIAAEQLVVDDDSGTGLTTEDNTEVQGAVLLGEIVALGFGVTSFTSHTTQFLSEGDRQSFGASIRLGEMFYLGYGQVSDEIDLTAGGMTISAERDGTLLGAAVRIEGPWAWYFAYDVIDLDNFSDPLFGDFGGRKLTLATAQLLANGVLVGAAVGEVEVKDAGASPVDTSVRIVDLGWAPAEGFTLTARLTSFDASDTTGFDDTAESTAFIVGWQF